MSGEKRQASNSFGTSQLVKRQKSNVDLGSNAVVSTNASAGNGALVQAVSHQMMASFFSQRKCAKMLFARRPADSEVR